MTNTTNPLKQRYHKIDGWRGYMMPAKALAGASDTGSFTDSPCPTHEVLEELNQFKAALKKEGIRYRTYMGSSSNVFCGKRWVVAIARTKDEFDKAAQFTVDWLHEHRNDTRFIHDADLEDLGYHGP